jgi:hypothetical protein
MPPEHLHLDVALGHVEDELQQEAVELRLGERVGALVLDRVLRGGDDERVREWERTAVDADLALLHRLQQGGLGLRGRSVDLVGEQDVREHRALAELELPGLGVVDERAGDVAGHEVGRELHALRVQTERVAERPDEERLRDAGHTLEERVALGEERDDEPGDGGVLTHDGLADLDADLGECPPEVVGVRCGGSWHGGVGHGWFLPVRSVARATAASRSSR